MEEHDTRCRRGGACDVDGTCTNEVVAKNEESSQYLMRLWKSDLGPDCNKAVLGRSELSGTEGSVE